MPKVVLTSASKNFSANDVKVVVNRAFDLLDYNYPRKVDTVVIKPNLCFYWEYSTGETTDPRVISAIIDYLRVKFGEDVNICVAEADASAMKTRHAFKILGYEKLSREKNVKLVNLSEGEIIEKQTQVKEKTITLPVNKILLESDLVINVPKLKNHGLVGVTCSLKNMFGAISKPRKFSYHPNLAATIVAINKLVKTNICIVDGLITSSKYPKKMGLILAGDDALATDFVVAKIAGFNPKSIEHMKLAAEESIGEVDDVNVIEENISIKEAKELFPHSSLLIHNISQGLQLRLLSLYIKLSGDVCPSFLKK